MVFQKKGKRDLKILRIFALPVMAALMTISAPAVSGAEEPEQPAYQMEEIVFTGAQIPSPEADTQTIRMESAGRAVVSTVPDAMDTAAGIDIQRRGILTPKNSQVRLRGLDERRSQILLNGRPLNGTGVMGGYFVDWTALSTQQIDTVDITKGAFSAKHGNSLGGAVSMTSNPPEKGFEARISTGYKRYNTFSADASVSGRQDAFAASLSAGHKRTDGHLRNSGAERTDVSGRFHYFWGDDGELQLSLRHSTGDYQMPVENRKNMADYDSDFPEHAGDYLAGPGIKFPGGDSHGDRSFFHKERTEADLRAQKQIGSLDSELITYINYEDRTDTLYSRQTGEKILERDAVPDRSWGWKTNFARPGKDHQIGFGAEGNYQGYGGTDNTYIRPGYFPKPPADVDDDWDATRWHGVYVDDTWDVSQKTDVYAGLRYDDYRGDRIVDAVTGYNAAGKPLGFEDQEVDFHEGVVQPKLGLVYSLQPWLSLYGRAGRAARFPDNPAFYWYYAGYQPELDSRTNITRKDLTYEDAMQYEAGAQYTGLKNLTVSATVYHYRVENYIRWIFGYAPSRVVYNVDRVDFTGAEIDATASLTKHISAFANFAWQDTKKHGDALDASNTLSDSLPELPEYKFNCGLSWQRPDGAMARVKLRWVDERQVPYLAGTASPDGASQFAGATAELRKMDDFVTMDLFFKYPVFAHLNRTGFLTGGVENLMDETYQEEYDFPAPGRSFHIGAELVF
jgi:iron complex outermembrane receptor protein